MNLPNHRMCTMPKRLKQDCKPVCFHAPTPSPLRSSSSLAPHIGQCPSTLRPAFSMLVFSTKKATEPYSDNLLNRARNPSKPYSDKETPLRRASRRLPCELLSQSGNPRKKKGTYTTWNRTHNRTRKPPDHKVPLVIWAFRYHPSD